MSRRNYNFCFPNSVPVCCVCVCEWFFPHFNTEIKVKLEIRMEIWKKKTQKPNINNNNEKFLFLHFGCPFRSILRCTCVWVCIIPLFMCRVRKCVCACVLFFFTLFRWLYVMCSFGTIPIPANSGQCDENSQFFSITFFFSIDFFFVTYCS